MQRSTRSTIVAIALPALVGLFGAIAVTGPEAAAQGVPPPLDALPGTVLSGAGDRDQLRIIDTGDINGDGAVDLAIGWTVRPGTGSTENHYGAVFGRPAWPAEATRDTISDSIEILLPQRRGALAPDTPDVSLGGFEDIDGDGIDDIFLARADETAGDVSLAVVVYRGHAGPWTDLDVEATPPDFQLVQPRIGRDAAAPEHIPRPNRFAAGDVNGDGVNDLMAFSCNIRSPRYGRGDEGALYVYLSPPGGPRDVDMSVVPPDHVIHGGEGELLGCLGSYGTQDFDGDGTYDQLITGWDVTRGEHVVRLLPGGAWPAVGYLSDLETAELYLVEEDNRADSSVYSPRFLPDVTGDGLPEIKVRSAGRVYQQSNLWFSETAPSGRVSIQSADLQLVETWFEREGLGYAGRLGATARTDVNADGRSDLAYMVQRKDDRGPWRWRYHFDALSLRGQLLRPRTDETVGDAAFELREQPNDQTRPIQWIADVTGDGIDDMWITEANATGPDRARQAGVNTLYVGPLSGPAAPTATPMPSSVPPSPTATAPPDTATPTSPPPSATPSPTALPLDGLYFPAVLRDWLR